MVSQDEPAHAGTLLDFPDSLLANTKVLEPWGFELHAEVGLVKVPVEMLLEIGYLGCCSHLAVEVEGWSGDVLRFEVPDRSPLSKKVDKLEIDERDEGLDINEVERVEEDCKKGIEPAMLSSG